MRGRIALAAWTVALGASLATAVADELDQHLADLKPQLEDRKTPIADRERLAMELAANLDAAAKQAETAEVARARWAEAAALLADFRARDPNHPQAKAFALQEAVYRWAEAQVWARDAEAHPGDPKPRARALRALDAAIPLLEPLVGARGQAGDALAQNARYRLARALADRAAIDPEAAGSARSGALALLDPPITGPALAGFAHLLRADLLTKQGRLDSAAAELDAAARSEPAPSGPEILEARVALLVARMQFDEALKAVEGSKLAEAPRDLLAVRVLLARRADLPVGPARSVVEAALYEKAEALRKSDRPEARAALAALARAIPQPDPQAGPEARDALAEGESILGHPDRAGALAASAAEKAAALGRLDRAAALRYRAAAFHFRAEQFATADALLTRLVDGPGAGPIRPKAGLLRILARAKVLEQARGGPAADAYLAALEGQVRDFPGAPETAEARWRLGRARLSAGDRERALALWSALPHGSPHWLDARLIAVDLRVADLDAQLLNGDPREARRLMEECQRALDGAEAEAGDAPERPVLDLRRARLDLTPDLGRPGAALAACDRLARSALPGDLAARARRLRIAALSRLGRTVDAERDAYAEVRRSPPADLLDLARLIDRAAAATESDLARRRAGALMRILLTPAAADSHDFPPALRGEAALRRARSLDFSGDPDAARRALADAAIDRQGLDDRQLADLADAYAQLDAPAPAVEAFRLLAHRRRAGSIPWLAARYGLALAYSQSGRVKEARQLIDGTAILHPDLGGAELRNKFERLRQKLAKE